MDESEFCRVSAEVCHLVRLTAELHCLPGTNSRDISRVILATARAADSPVPPGLLEAVRAVHSAPPSFGRHHGQSYTDVALRIARLHLERIYLAGATKRSYALNAQVVDEEIARAAAEKWDSLSVSLSGFGATQDAFDELAELVEWEFAAARRQSPPVADSAAVGSSCVVPKTGSKPHAGLPIESATAGPHFGLTLDPTTKRAFREVNGRVETADFSQTDQQWASLWNIFLANGSATQVEKHHAGRIRKAMEPLGLTIKAVRRSGYLLSLCDPAPPAKSPPRGKRQTKQARSR